MPTTARPVPASTLTDEQFLTSHAYRKLSAEDAAGDPRTPESYLTGLGLLSVGQFFAMAQRRPMTRPFAGWLVRLARTADAHRLFDRCGNRAVTAAAQLPFVDAWWLEDLAGALRSWEDGFTEAALTLVHHPASTEQVAARVLVLGEGGYGIGTDLEQQVAATGSLVPAALTLVRTERTPGATATPRHLITAALAVAAELEAAVDGDPARRQVTAALGATWHGTRAELLAAARAVST